MCIRFMSCLDLLFVAVFQGQEQAESATNNDAALRRSVDVASRMAGWAGRVVERVLKEHKQVVAIHV